MLLDGFLYGFIHVPPVPNDVRIRFPPHGYQRLKLVFRKAHLDGSHGFQGTDRAAVTQSQLSDFAFLAEMRVLTVLLNRDFEHLAGGGTVNVAAGAENFCSPFFTGKVAKHPGFDRGKVRNDELVPWPGNEGSSDQFGKDTRHRIIQHIQHVKVTLLHEIPCLLQVGHVVLRQVLQLD